MLTGNIKVAAQMTYILTPSSLLGREAIDAIFVRGTIL